MIESYRWKESLREHFKEQFENLFQDFFSTVNDMNILDKRAEFA